MKGWTRRGGERPAKLLGHPTRDSTKSGLPLTSCLSRTDLGRASRFKKTVGVSAELPTSWAAFPSRHIPGQISSGQCRLLPLLQHVHQYSRQRPPIRTSSTRTICKIDYEQQQRDRPVAAYATEGSLRCRRRAIVHCDTRVMRLRTGSSPPDRLAAQRTCTA